MLFRSENVPVHKGGRSEGKLVAATGCAKREREKFKIETEDELDVANELPSFCYNVLVCICRSSLIHPVPTEKKKEKKMLITCLALWLRIKERTCEDA